MPRAARYRCRRHRCCHRSTARDDVAAEARVACSGCTPAMCSAVCSSCDEKCSRAALLAFLGNDGRSAAVHARVRLQLPPLHLELGRIPPALAVAANGFGRCASGASQSSRQLLSRCGPASRCGYEQRTACWPRLHIQLILLLPLRVLLPLRMLVPLQPQMCCYCETPSLLARGTLACSGCILGQVFDLQPTSSSMRCSFGYCIGKQGGRVQRADS